MMAAFSTLIFGFGNLLASIGQKFTKRLALAGMILLILSNRSLAQVDIVIGTGTVGNANTTYPCPIQDFYEGSRSQYLYLASELIAAGMGPGTISNIKFNVISLTTSTGPTQAEQYSIKIGTSSTASLNLATWEPGANTVYGPVDYTATVGINTFTFSTPFFWNGVDNIIVEICNGDPSNTTGGAQFTGNPVMPWTTGLSFNGSHTYRADNLGNLCNTATTTNTGTATTRPNIIFGWTAASACTGTPAGGAATASAATVCSPTTPVSLSVTGSTAASGLTYQWEFSTNGGTTWANLTGATQAGILLPGVATTTSYRRRTSCGANTATSLPVTVTVLAPVYTVLPFTESFENSWIDICDIRDVPANYWRNAPVNGDASWRRDDDGAAASWTNNFGTYTPTASAGQRSARFHSYQVAAGGTGTLDLFVNCATPATTKILNFDFINTSGNDSLVVFFSTNGGATFTRLDSVRTAAQWRTKTITFNSTSATTVLRFRATGDFGVTDIGLDNITLADYPDCTGTPVGGTASASTSNACTATTPIILTVTGSTQAGALTYQWQTSTDAGVTWNNIAGATGATYTSPGISANTLFRRLTICAGSGSSTPSTSVGVSVPALQYTTLPFVESFESTWLSLCDVREVPNAFWRNTPLTGNNSWRRDDDPAAWSNNFGTYTPTASAGQYSARFHSYQAASGTSGSLDLYVNCATPAATKILSFDFINTSGNDSLVVLFSVDGGVTFTRIDSARTATQWRNKSMTFVSTSATTILRFRATSDFGVTDIGLDNISLAEFPNCSGTPVGGNAGSSLTSVCNNATPFTLNVTGSTIAASLTWQWQQSTDGGTTWTNITGATGQTLNVTGISATTQYRRVTTCAGNSSNSASVTVTFATPTYTTLPFAESFETTWASICATRDVPANHFRNNPFSGNNSWRRDDDGAAAGWTTTGGAYTPTASVGQRSARFHSDIATSGSRGLFDLYVNGASGTALKNLSFDYINTDGNDSLVIRLSTDGGTTFTRLDSVRTATVWTTKNIQFSTTSATTVIRFEAVSDNGTTDIGLDNIFLVNWIDCTGTPNGGTAQASVTNACVDPFTLSVTGASSGNGIGYQWQSSTNGTTWTNIPGANGLNYTTTQIGTTFYRLVVSCAFSGTSVNSTSVQVISPVPAAGTYTINNAAPTDVPARTFNNFNDAYNHIKCGISAPVIFNVLTGTGPYNEQLIMTPVPGASAVNTVTFRGNGAATIAFASTNSNERAVIKLRGTKHIVFDSLVIDASAGTFGYGVQLMANTDSNTIKSCIIRTNATATTTNYAGVVLNGTDAGPVATGIVLSDFNKIHRNTIIGGYYGVTLASTFTNGASGFNEVKDNDIRDFYQTGVYVAGTYNTLIEGNTIHRPNRTAVIDFYGILFTTQKNTLCLVTRNRIKNPFGAALGSTQAFYGISFENSDGSASGGENTVSNNLIYRVNGNGLAYGINNVSSDFVFYLHNTISIDSALSTAAAATRGFSQTTLAGGLFFLNNIVSIGRGGNGTKHAIYLANGVMTLSDNNDFFVSSTAGSNHVGFLTSNRTTISDWKLATGQETSSISAVPAYLDVANENYTPGNAGIDNIGFPIGVTVDLLNVSRNLNTPDIGAYEFTPPACSVPPTNGTVKLSVTSICQNQPVLLSMNIGPYGSGQTFQWQAASNINGPYTNLSSPLPITDTTILSTVTQYYRVAIRCAGGSLIYSDTVLLTVNPALPGGTYTINKTAPTNYVPGVAGGNFNSFADAKTAMGCGIFGGPVVFNVVAGTGPYTEQLKLDSIAGATAVNTITFNGNGNTIAFNSTNSNERAVIKLNGADHIRFDSLRVDASGGTFGYGFQLINNADSNIIRRCTIVSATNSTTQNYAGIVVNSTDAGPIAVGNTRCDNNLFDRNTIVGGHFGITLVGANTALDYIARNVVSNNKIQDFYGTGIYLAGTVNTTIQSNELTRPQIAIASPSLFGIQLAGTPSNFLRIDKNRFSNPYGGNLANAASTYYAIYHNNVDAVAGSETVVSNNLVHNLNGNGAVYGFYNIGSNNVRYFHNTIAIDSPSTTGAQTAAFYQTTLATGIEFKNNLITLYRGGTGQKHGMYLATNTSEVFSDNNNCIVGTGAHIGFFNGNRTTLAAWQTATSRDAASLSIDPIYRNPNAGDFTPGILPLDNKGAQLGILDDILGITRGTIPDIGAFEFAPPVCVSPPVAGTASVTPNTGVCLEFPITLTLNGHSPLGTLTFQWQGSPDGVNNWVDISPVQYGPQFNTVTSVNRFYRAKVTCNGNMVLSNVVNVNLNSIMLSGTYTINGGTPTNYVSTNNFGNFNTFQEAVTAMQCGVAGAVTFDVAAGTYNEQIRIPYIPGTSPSARVTFRSANGNPSSVNLTFAGTTANNYTLRLDSTRFFTFRNMSFTATGSTFGRVIDLVASASHDSIVGCRITGPSTTAATLDAVGIFANAFRGDSVVLRNNVINFGTHGIYLSGVGTTQLAAAGNRIDGNSVGGSFSHGIAVFQALRPQVTNNVVIMDGNKAANAAGIWMNADSSFRLQNNRVLINNTTAAIDGITIVGALGRMADSSIVSSNTVIADAGNTGLIEGISLASSRGVSVVNNVMAINSGGAGSNGLVHLNNIGDINYYNNTIQVLATSANTNAGSFTQTTTVSTNLRNNIFANGGGGRALFVNDPALYNADYNMLHSTGSTLVSVATGSVTSFATLKAWQNNWNWDRTSISYAPAFVSATNLQPDLNNPNVWAMHGRGVQVRGNSFDFRGDVRPTTLTAGVPDLGAYEFFPTALPTVMLATPATPAPNATQTFSYGTDTVMRITWGSTAPPSVEVRRFSGVVPSGLVPGTDSMYFYTKVDIPGGANYNYGAKLYFIDSWQGSIPQLGRLGMGRTTASNAWVVGSNSKIDLGKREISQDAIVYLDRFTGLTNAFSVPENEDSSSNRGKDFWVGYQRSNGFSEGNGQVMRLYLGAGSTAANVTVTIQGTSGTPWVRNYFVPANTAIISDEMPKAGADDSRLETEGRYNKRGIHITSDVPVVAYAHIYQSTNSGATMLMPTAVWGYEYYVLTSRQNYTSVSYSAFHVVAQSDSTWVEINPSKPTLNGWVPNGGTQPNGSYLVKLNKGDAYQVLGAILTGAEGHDLTGSYVKSIGNAQGQCFPIAVFSGSTRTGIGCTTPGGSGDLIIQQIFPYQAWGTKYATAPTTNAAGPNATSSMTNVYRVMVKDTTTIVKRNGVVIPANTLIGGRYYQYQSGTADYIESNKPILVAQYMSSSGSCPNTTGNGDPEMFYLSPVQQAVKSTQFYRNNQTAITTNYITMVIPDEGLGSLRIDGISYQSYPAADIFVYPHPNLSGHSVVTKRWGNAAGSSTAESDFPFTGIVYGIGSVESYGYNMGTLVKNLNNLSSVNNSFNSGVNPTEYTCKGAPFRVKVLLPIIPDRLTWKFSQVPKLSPNVDSVQINPRPIDSTTVNGVLYYVFTVNQNFVLDTAGVITIPIEYMSPTIERCDQKQPGAVIVQILPSPVTDFKINIPGNKPGACEGETVGFVGDQITSNGIALNQWNWTFHTGATAQGQTQSFTYPTAGTYDVKLRGITADGCISDTTKRIVINPKPVVTLVSDSLTICPGNSATFTVSNPIAGATYNWYNAATGGTLLGTGTSFTATNVTPPYNVFVEATSTAGCTSAVRKRATAAIFSPIGKPVVSVTTRAATSVTFSWTAVTGASGYQVSVDGGPFITPSSGTTGLTHTVTGLSTLQTVNLVVKAISANGCSDSQSDALAGCANSAPVVVTPTQTICRGTNATFSVQSPGATIIYRWYTTATGGTPVATGSSFTATNVTANTTFYVEQSTAVGCVGTPRTMVQVNILPDLTRPVVTTDSIGVNTIRFRWNAVVGANAYEVSEDNGATWITPSSGATGLTHTINNLRPATEVTILVRAKGGCADVTSDLYRDRTRPDKLFVPNSFTPNGDGLNDRLLLFGYGVRDMRMMIFNQWGEKIFESGNQNTGWDGTYNGKPQPSGVYMYVCTVTLTDGTKQTLKGSINLIR